MLIPLAVMIVFAKEPPDNAHQSFKEHVSCLFTKDGWAFSLIYVITLRRLRRPVELPADLLLRAILRDEGRGRAADHAGRLLMGSGIRIVGGYYADRMGGIAVLSVVLLAAIATFLSLMATPSLP